MDNPLKGIFSNIKLFQSSGGEFALGVDVGSSSIKVVEVKKKSGKVALETYGVISLGPYAQEDMGKVTNLSIEQTAEALREVMKQAETSTYSCGISIPVQSSLIFSISLPPQVADSQIRAVVPIEARKYIPVPITEVSLDYFVLPAREPTFEEENNPEAAAVPPANKEVLVVAIQNDAIAKYRSLSSQCGLDAGFFELEIFSSMRANLEHELSLVLLIDFGASRTRLSLIEFGMLKAYHTVNRGGADITDAIARSLSIPFSKAEEMKKEYGLFENPAEKNLSGIIKTHLDYIFSETNTMLFNYEKKYGKSPAKIIFSGGGSMLKGLTEAAAANFRANIEIGRPFEKVGAPAFLEKVLSATGPEFAVAIGLALRKLQ